MSLTYDTVPPRVGISGREKEQLERRYSRSREQWRYYNYQEEFPIACRVFFRHEFQVGTLIFGTVRRTLLKKSGHSRACCVVVLTVALRPFQNRPSWPEMA